MYGKERIFHVPNRGFTIRLKSLGPPILRGPNILGVRTICRIFVSNYICILVLVQRSYFYYAKNKLYLVKKNECEGLKGMTMSNNFSWRCESVIVT